MKKLILIRHQVLNDYFFQVTVIWNAQYLHKSSSHRVLLLLSNWFQNQRCISVYYYCKFMQYYTNCNSNLKFYTSHFLWINISKGICEILDHFIDKLTIQLKGIILDKTSYCPTRTAENFSCAMLKSKMSLAEKFLLCGSLY